MSKKGLLPHRLVAYMERDVSPSEAAAVEAQLAESPAARRRLASYRRIADTLGRPQPELESVDLVGAVASQLAPAAAGRPTRPRPWLLYAGALAAAACAAVILGWTRPDSRDEVRRKGSAAAHAQRWAGVRLYRAAGAEPPALVETEVSRRDGVLVSYTNLGPRPFDYLMVFAVDAERQVTWLYPAWERASDNPTAIPVHKGVADMELRALIRPNWALGRLTLHALFTRRPLGVHEVEAQLARAAGPLSIPDSEEQVLTFSVVP